MAKRGPKKSEHPHAPLNPASLHGLKAAFLDWMTVTHFSPHTLRTKGNALAFFLRWCDARGLTRPAEINGPILERYRRHTYEHRQANGKPLSLKTQLQRLVAVRTFFKWLARRHHILYNPATELELPRSEKRLPSQILTIQEVETIINQTNINEPLGIRDRAMLETLYSTGMRRAELIGLKLYDLSLDQGTVMIRQGKGRKDRVVPIGERAIAWLDKYLLDVRPTLVQEPDDGSVFLTVEGTPFSDHVSDLVHGYVKSANLGKMGSCHVFRHACATHMLENGADVRIIQAILGHAALTTTEIYTRVSIQHLKTVHTKTHPAKLTRTARAEADSPDTHAATHALLTALATEVDEDKNADGDEDE